MSTTVLSSSGARQRSRVRGMWTGKKEHALLNRFSQVLGVLDDFTGQTLESQNDVFLER